MARVRDWNPGVAYTLGRGGRKRIAAQHVFSSVAVLAAVILIWRVPLGAPNGVSVLLAALALAADFLPIRMRRDGWSFRMTLPYLASLAIASGPTASLYADLGISLVQILVRPDRLGRSWMANLSITLFCGAMAGLPWILPIHASPILLGLMYALFHTTANVGGVKIVEAVNGLRPRPASEMNPGMLALCMYFLLTLTTAEMASEGWGLWIPATFAPLIALRAFFDHRWSSQRRHEETVAAISHMLQSAHPGTHRHLERVSDLAEGVARRLGLSQERSYQVRLAAILHDIGKVAVDERVLDKPDRLTPEEFNHVKRHAEMGAAILAPVPSLANVALWIRHHHERPDGNGYPDRLADEQIPIESKIIAVVDAFDAMTGGVDGSDKRPYKAPMSTAAALEELEKWAGSQFDPGVVNAFRQELAGGKR